MNVSLANAPTSPLSEERASLLLQLTEGLEPAALQWLSGYTAGLAAQQPSTKASQLHAVPALHLETDARLTIIYGSQTGNARREAEALEAEARSLGLNVRLFRADAYPLKELVNERLLTVVISTQGDGDPPNDALAFVEFISGRRAPALPELQFAVLGLGDSSYPLFNAVAKKIDARLAELGGTRLSALAEADIDVAAVASPWRQQALIQIRERLHTSKPSALITELHPVVKHAIVSPTFFSRNQPFSAEVLQNQRITGRASQQDIRHLEIALGEQLSYEPGDALGIWPHNDAAHVSSLINTLGLSADESISIGEQSHSLQEWLSSKREITRLSKAFLQQHAERANSAELNALLGSDNAQAIAAFLSQQHVVDVLRQHPATWTASELVQALRPMTPRLYSIASSQKAVGLEAHLTVALANYARESGQALGVASGYLSQQQEGDTLPVFIERNERFHLPQDPSRDILMIGPGTGVAPFRGFLQERVETGASGKNWLLFGAQHAESQFLYQLEWLDALKKGQLHRMDLAFSRDQAERVYVQQRLREHAADVYAWLQNGAHVYICGAIAMGKDVQQTLIDIVSQQAAISLDDAKDYISQLQQNGRLAKDVY
jgi:sulfite reductase (NADPH) flavoprotein alpha-component